MNSSTRSKVLRCASAMSTTLETEGAVAEICQAVLSRLDSPPNFAAVFASPHHAPNFGKLGEAIALKLGTSNVLGCTGESIVGTGREIELAPALSLFAATLPDAVLTPLHLSFERTPDGGLLAGWPANLTEEWPPNSTLLLLGEPFSFPVEMLLEQMNDEQPGTSVIGGMASGAAGPGENRLLLGSQVFREGAVAMLLHGPVKIRSVTSQGCRPIGTPMIVTQAERNVIQQLGGQPAMNRLREVFATLPTRDQQLLQRGLHVGRVMSEYKDRFEQGDFLIRNVIGADADSGAIAIGDYVRVGQTVQFHLHDEQSADAELKQLLARAKNEAAGTPAGALLFTCNGRGTRLFSHEHHDAQCVANAFGDVPVAGFFAQGELGPVGGKNFIHGFTASLAIFESLTSVE